MKEASTTACVNQPRPFDLRMMSSEQDSAAGQPAATSLYCIDRTKPCTSFCITPQGNRFYETLHVQERPQPSEKSTYWPDAGREAG